jgi:hypothetical protein
MMKPTPEDETSVPRRWFYTHHKQTFGPVPVEDLPGLAAEGRLGPDDWVWPEDVDSRQAVPARTLLGGPDPNPSPQPSPPDWLEDVRKVEQVATTAAAAGKAGVPDWLSDVRDAPQQRPNRSAGEPGWLDDIRQTEVPTLPLSALEEELPPPPPPEPPSLPEPDMEVLPVGRTQGPPQSRWLVWALIPVGFLVVVTLFVWVAAELFHLLASK